MAVPGSKILGARKYTPLELMLRVTNVTGIGSTASPTRVKRKGSDSDARGLLRLSCATPMACVGTRANRFGPGLCRPLIEIVG